MLDDKKLLQLIRYIEVEMNIDYIVATNLTQKIRHYGYDLFSNKNLLTKKEKTILDKANKKIEKMAHE